VCPTLQAESLYVSGEADGQVPPVLKKYLLSLRTLTQSHAPISRLPRPLLPPGELSLSVHFTQE